MAGKLSEGVGKVEQPSAALSSIMSHEFELHHLVSELVSLLRVSETADVDSQVDLLSKNRTPYITTQVGVQSQ